MVGEADDPILALEHGLFLQETQWDHYSAILEYQRLLALPGASTRLTVEAKFHLAECYEARDCPSAALALYQTISRQYSDFQPFAKLAASRVAESLARSDEANAAGGSHLPSANVTAHLGDLLLLLQGSLKSGEGKLATQLVSHMRAELDQVDEELKLAPVNEPASRGSQRQAAVNMAQRQRAALDIVSSSIDRTEMDVAIRMATSDSSLQTLLDRRSIYPSQIDWGAMVTSARTALVKSMAASDSAGVDRDVLDLQTLIKPVEDGPGGNPLVQTAQATLQWAREAQGAAKTGDWTAARTKLVMGLNQLHHRHHTSLHARVPGWQSLSPSYLPGFVGILTHVSEAIEDVRSTQRKENVIQHLDTAISKAQLLSSEWFGETEALGRLQKTLQALQQARSLASAGDLAQTATVLRREVYF